MNFYLSLLLLVTVSLCCTRKPDEATTVTNAKDSISRPSNTTDTSVGAGNHDVALPGINFGVSVKDYLAANRYVLQGLGENTYFIKPLFDNKSRLYKIELSGLSYNTSHADTELWEDHDNLVSYLQKHDGPPKVLASNVKLSKMKPGQITWTRSWSKSEKRMKVGIAKGSNSETFEVVGLIYNESMADQKVLTDSLIVHPAKKSSKGRKHKKQSQGRTRKNKES